MAIVVDKDDAARRPGPDRQRRPLPRAAQPQLRHERRRRRDAGQGRPGRRGHSVFNTVAEAVSEAGANTTLIFVPARFAVDADLRGGRRRNRHGDLHHRAHPGARHAPRLHVHPPAWDHAGRARTAPACSRPGRRTSGSSPPRSSARATSASSRGRGRSRYQIGHELHAARPRQLDHRRHRRRSGRRLVVHRHPREFEADPETEYVVLVGEIGGERGGEGGGVHRRADDEARVRLHRRLLGAAGQDDGPRGRDHLRHVRARRRRRRMRSRRVGVVVGTTPTEVAQLVAERIGVRT